MITLLLSMFTSKNSFRATETQVKCSFGQIVSVSLSSKGNPTCGGRK